MVYSPSTYLVSAAIAFVALQIQQVAGSSLYYAPITTSGTTDKITNKFPAFGADVADQDCVITVEVDPTLPNIANISTVPVTYPDLLANASLPSEPVHTKVGTVVLSTEVPPADANQDAYVSSRSTISTTPDAPVTKSGTTESITPGKTGTNTTPSVNTVQDEIDKASDCATGWEEDKTSRKLLEKLEMKRQLEVKANNDIAQLEAYFGKPMEMKLKNLPTQCVHTPSPWPGPYWPTYQDGINVQWDQGQKSPAEKYATAFGLDVTDFMNKVSKDNGIDSMSSHRQCSSDNDCAGLTDGSLCGIRAGKTSGYCIPGWFGICHAWTPASIMEPEPNCPVTHNGVTFQPMDIKGLITDIYDGAGVATVFTGARFKGGEDIIDQYGRHSNPAYRDMNPAYFHIAATNLLCNLNMTFVADVTAGLEVWNQPVRGFKVYEQTAMSLEDAAQTFYGLEAYPWNAAAKSIIYVKSRLSWVFETYTDGPLVSSDQVDQYTTGAYYTYILEMDDDGVIIGGEWVYDSDSTHPDFLWFPKSKPAANTVTRVGLSYTDVSMLLEKSVACSDSSTASAAGSESVGSGGSPSITPGSGSTAASRSGSSSTGSAPVSSSTGSMAATETPVATTTAAPATTTTAPAGSIPSNNGHHGHQGHAVPHHGHQGHSVPHHGHQGHHGGNQGNQQP